MDRAVVDRRLDSLSRCVQRVRERAPATLDELVADADAQDILSLNLTRSVQLCVDIGVHLIIDTEESPPETLCATFDALANACVIDEKLAQRMRTAVGFRNVAIHRYEEIDWAIVFAIARDHLVDFEDFARAVVRARER